jgi:hypothetical protein
MTTITGSCRCGHVAYTASGGIKAVLNCHCDLCRRLSGCAFSSYVVVEQSSLELTGEPHVRSFQATDRAIKHFCTTCGTPVFNTNGPTYPGLAMLYLGTVADHANLVPAFNIYCEGKLGWVDAIAGARSFEQGTPTRKD